MATQKVPQDHKEKEAPVTNQVQTVVNIDEQRIVIACPKCGQQQLNMGVKFCSNCAHPLKWENIIVLQPSKQQQQQEQQPQPQPEPKIEEIKN